MPGTTETVLMHYLGLGFVILLGWAIAVPDHQLDEPTARHYLRWTTIAAIIGILHPPSRSPPETSSAQQVVTRRGGTIDVATPPGGEPSTRCRDRPPATG